MISVVLANSVDTLFRIFFWLIIGRAILSWIRPSSGSKLLSDLNRTIHVLTEPILAPIRNLIPGGGMGIDWSPLIALFLLEIVRNVVVGLLVRI